MFSKFIDFFKIILLLFCIVSCSSGDLQTGTVIASVKNFRNIGVLRGERIIDNLPGIEVAHKVWQSGNTVVIADIKTELLHIFTFPEFSPVKTISLPYKISSEGIDFFETEIKDIVCGMRSRLGGQIHLLTDDFRLLSADDGAVYARKFNKADYNDIIPIYMDGLRFWFSSVDKRDSVEKRSVYRITRGTDHADDLYCLELKSFPGYDMNFFPWGAGTLYKRGKMMVYAYEQFKVVKFMKADGSGERTVDYLKYFNNSIDARWKYIWGYYRGQIFAAGNRIYLSNYEYGYGNLSRKYTPDTLPFDPFTAVEVYSGNGDQLAVWQLDHEGFVIVDHRHRKIYLINFDDNSLWRYEIPRR